MLLAQMLKPSVVMDGEKYVMSTLIGEGGFAYVYKAKSAFLSKTKGEYAIKKMICQTDEQIFEAKQEMHVLKIIQHEHVIRLLKHAVSVNKKGQQEFVLLMPLYSRSVHDCIEKFTYPACSLPIADLHRIIKGCVSGIMAIHQVGYRHADFKPANVMLNADNSPIIIDLGSTAPLVTNVDNRKQALEIQELAAVHTTGSFRAPELYDTPSQCTIDGKTDVWSLGCFIYSLLFSKTPFEDGVNGLSTLALMSGSYPVPSNKNTLPWSDLLMDMLAACLKVEPGSRVDMAEVQMKVYSEEFTPSSLICTSTTSTPAHIPSTAPTMVDQPHQSSECAAESVAAATAVTPPKDDADDAWDDDDFCDFQSYDPDEAAAAAGVATECRRSSTVSARASVSSSEAGNNKDNATNLSTPLRRRSSLTNLFFRDRALSTTSLRSDAGDSPPGPGRSSSLSVSSPRSSLSKRRSSLSMARASFGLGKNSSSAFASNTNTVRRLQQQLIEYVQQMTTCPADEAATSMTLAGPVIKQGWASMMRLKRFGVGELFGAAKENVSKKVWLVLMPAMIILQKLTVEESEDIAALATDGVSASRRDTGRIHGLVLLYNERQRQSTGSLSEVNVHAEGCRLVLSGDGALSAAMLSMSFPSTSDTIPTAGHSQDASSVTANAPIECEEFSWELMFETSEKAIEWKEAIVSLQGSFP